MRRGRDNRIDVGQQGLDVPLKRHCNPNHNFKAHSTELLRKRLRNYQSKKSNTTDRSAYDEYVKFINLPRRSRDSKSLFACFCSFSNVSHGTKAAQSIIHSYRKRNLSNNCLMLSSKKEHCFVFLLNFVNL